VREVGLAVLIELRSAIGGDDGEGKLFGLLRVQRRPIEPPEVTAFPEGRGRVGLDVQVRCRALSQGA
jgi:hypothetical protein